MITSVVFRDKEKEPEHWPNCSAMWEAETRELGIVDVENGLQHVYSEPELIELVVMNFVE